MIHENFTWPKYDQRYLNPVTIPFNPYRLISYGAWLSEEIKILYRDYLNYLLELNSNA